MIRRTLLAALIFSCHLLAGAAMAQTAVEVRVAASTDDAMTETGSVIYLTEGLSEFKSAYLSNGFRFLNVTVPQGSTIDSAVIFFTTNEASSGAVTLTIVGEDVDDAATFTTYANYSGRSRTTATQSWAIATGDQWTTQVTDGKQSVDFKSVVQEITDRAGWASGNDMVIMIDYTSGTGQRNTYTYNASAALAPKLRIVYSSGGAPATDLNSRGNQSKVGVRGHQSGSSKRGTN